MQKYIPLLAILSVLLYALYNAKFRDAEKVETHIHKHYKEHIKTHKTTHYSDELSQINTGDHSTTKPLQLPPLNPNFQKYFHKFSSQICVYLEF